MSRREGFFSVKITSFILLVIMSFVRSTSQPAPTRLAGVVTDSAGASLPKARVLLVDLATLDTQKTQVGLNGAFHFDLKAGDYAVITAGPLDTPCWKPAVRQVHTGDGENSSMRIPLILDTKKCSEVIE